MMNRTTDDRIVLLAEMIAGPGASEQRKAEIGEALKDFAIMITLITLEHILPRTEVAHPRRIDLAAGDPPVRVGDSFMWTDASPRIVDQKRFNEIATTLEVRPPNAR